jgi:hypothetical protein
MIDARHTQPLRDDAKRNAVIALPRVRAVPGAVQMPRFSGPVARISPAA